MIQAELFFSKPASSVHCVHIFVLSGTLLLLQGSPPYVVRETCLYLRSWELNYPELLLLAGSTMVGRSRGEVSDKVQPKKKTSMLEQTEDGGRKLQQGETTNRHGDHAVGPGSLSIKDCVVAFSAVQSLHVKKTSQPSINLEGHFVYTPLCNNICGHRSGFFGISRPKLKIHQEDNHTKLRVIIDDDTLPVCEMGSSKESQHSEQRYLFLSHT